MKKILILIISLAIITLILGGCSDVFSGKPNLDSISQGIVIPEGFGAVRINVAFGNARTAFPAIENSHYPDHTVIKYKYFFENEQEQEPNYKNNEGDVFFILAPGTYSLLIKAYFTYVYNVTDYYEYLFAEGCSEFTIGNGETSPVTVTLSPFELEGTGTFFYSITAPSNTTITEFKLTRIIDANNFDVENRIDIYSSFGPIINSTSWLGLEGIPAGYYLLQLTLVNDNGYASKSEVVHIYKNMNTIREYDFTNVKFIGLLVTNTKDDNNSGSLRYALNNASSGQVIRVMLPPGSVIKLESSLIIDNKGITLDGNGVTITKGTDWSGDNLLRIKSYDATTDITIRRIHFKDGCNESDGGAIYSDTNQSMFVESCIFSGNKANSGGAIYNESGTINVKGCTFYRNIAANNGGAIHNNNSLELTGNLFYGNVATYNSVVSGNFATSKQYNVVDVKFYDSLDTNAKNCGWVNNNDKYAPNPTLIEQYFNPINIGDENAVGIISNLPEKYPTTDFYGYPINIYAAAGAVQVEESTYYKVTFNKMGGNSIDVSVIAVKSGHTIQQEPIEPIWPGNKFKYWYEDNNTDAKWIFKENQVKNELTLCTLWDTQSIWSENEVENTIAAKLSWLSDNAEYGGSYTIIVTNNESLYPQELYYETDYGYSKTVNIILKSDNTKRKISLPESGTDNSLFTIKNGVTLILEDIILQGLDSYYSPLVHVNGGNLIMSKGATITGNDNKNSSSCGGSVYVDEYGIFTMNAGTISGNKAFCGGGVYVKCGTFTMNGGTISGNTATGGFGGGVYVGNDGLEVNGKFIKTGGIIYGNDGSDNKNVALPSASAAKGHAVYVTQVRNDSGLPDLRTEKQRNTTADDNNNGKLNSDDNLNWE